MILRLVDAWQGYTKRHPVVVMLTLTLLFTCTVLMINALDSTYEKNNETIPGTMVGAIIALYLGSIPVRGRIVR